MDTTEAWRRTAARLGDGWTLDRLRCASAALGPDERSEEWVAVAMDPNGQEHRFQAPDPVSALDSVTSDEGSGPQRRS